MHHENEKMALFEALYREYLVPLKKYAYRIGVGYDDIEDMVHEAFIEYYKRYSLDLDHKVKLVLLIRILRSKWIDNRRQMRRREMLHLEDPDAEEEIMNLLLKIKSTVCCTRLYRAKAELQKRVLRAKLFDI